MMVGQLTQEQRDALVNVKYNDHYYFNPVKDNDGNWVITEYEIDNCNLEWVKQIPRITFNPSTTKIEL